MTTEACLLSRGRNPELSKAEIERELMDTLGAEKILWLPCGIYNDETNEHVDNICAFTSPAEVVLAWMMTGRTLRSVDRMRRDAEAISMADLSARITAPSGDPDLMPLAETLNGLLARIEASVTEQKRFLSDASHELKSPIAATSLILQALRNNPEGLKEAEVLDDLTSENERLARIVDDLLVLARQDEGRLVAEFAAVDFYDLLHEEAALLRQRTAMRVDESGLQLVIGQTDGHLLGHAVRNLLDNAARYAHSKVASSGTMGRASPPRTGNGYLTASCV